MIILNSFSQETYGISSVNSGFSGGVAKVVETDQPFIGG